MLLNSVVHVRIGNDNHSNVFRAEIGKGDECFYRRGIQLGDTCDCRHSVRIMSRQWTGRMDVNVATVCWWSTMDLKVPLSQMRIASGNNEILCRSRSARTSSKCLWVPERRTRSDSCATAQNLDA